MTSPPPPPPVHCSPRSIPDLYPHRTMFPEHSLYGDIRQPPAGFPFVVRRFLTNRKVQPKIEWTFYNVINDWRLVQSNCWAHGNETIFCFIQRSDAEKFDVQFPYHDYLSQSAWPAINTIDPRYQQMPGTRILQGKGGEIEVFE